MKALSRIPRFRAAWLAAILTSPLMAQTTPKAVAPLSAEVLAAIAEQPDRAKVILHAAGRDWCGTGAGMDGVRAAKLGSGDCQIMGSADLPANRDACIPGAGTPIKTIRLRFNILRDDNGSNAAATETDVARQLEQLNADYLPSRIQFVGTTRFINSSRFRGFADSEVNIVTRIAFGPAASGRTVQLRWRCATDNDTSDAGWGIDNVRITSPEPIGDPVVTIVATHPVVSEAGEFPPRSSFAAPLDVSVRIAGSASNAEDYLVLSPLVRIPAGSATAVVEVVPVEDGVAEPEETVELTVLAGAGYDVGLPNTAAVRILDGDSLSDVITFAEDFDHVTVPDLPAGWSVQRTGVGAPWSTVPDPDPADNEMSATVQVMPSAAPIQEFASDGQIIIREIGPAAAYPSTIEVSGSARSIQKVTVTLNGLSHTFPDDLDILLVGPDGRTVLLMSDSGGDSRSG